MEKKLTELENLLTKTKMELENFSLKYEELKLNTDETLKIKQNEVEQIKFSMNIVEEERNSLINKLEDKNEELKIKFDEITNYKNEIQSVNGTIEKLRTKNEKILKNTNDLSILDSIQSENSSLKKAILKKYIYCLEFLGK